MDSEGKFYIGRQFDVRDKQILDTPVLYDPDDLTTHGVVVGMTGSGKTGLCIDILEEAALEGIPAILIDPKGDIGNLLLHFPELSPADFAPWVDPDEARRDGISQEELAVRVAGLWRKGLAEWDIAPERIGAVRSAADYVVYTPGSDAGLPVSVLASLQAPDIPWEDNAESLRERISTTVTALLSLVGIEADPVRSREHILLANILEHLWAGGQDLKLSELIELIQRPPFDQLGALELEQFYPAEKRFELAMALNGLLASPTFQAWMEGAPLDIQSFLWTVEGRPRQSIFYLSHLSERERMFFVTLLLTAVESWMRTQPGSPSLRALIYFDEVLGFLPPVAKPPSKDPLMRLLKQARAFGVGLLLATQNPVDLDYKGLSNAGTWFIGRLQTEQDKARLLDGLDNIVASQGGYDRTWADKLISDLDKRVFLLNNVHADRPQVFYTRWAMAYLKGPITRDQIPQLNALAESQAVGAQPPAAPAPLGAAVGAEPGPSSQAESESGSEIRPVVPRGVDEVFLPNNLTIAQALKSESLDLRDVSSGSIMYRPTLLAQAAVRYLDRGLDLDHEAYLACLLEDPAPRRTEWEAGQVAHVDNTSLDPAPAPGARFSPLSAPLSDEKMMKALGKDFLDFVYHSAELHLLSNPALELVAQPGTTEAEFKAQCALAAKEARDAEAAELQKKYGKKIESLRDKLAREERELSEDQAELSARKMEEMATHAENVLGLFMGSRRRVTTSLTKRRMTQKAKADVEESQAAIEDLRGDLADMEAEVAADLDDIDERWAEAGEQIEIKVVKPYKKYIQLDLFGVAWHPYWRLESNGRWLQAPAYRAREV